MGGFVSVQLILSKYLIFVSTYFNIDQQPN